MELVKITEKVFYIQGSVNIGVILLSENSCCLVDTGLNEDTARKVYNLLTEKKIAIKAIINTHHHADHCGGNKLLKDRSGAKIYAPAFEEAIISNTLLEPIYLFSGAFPIDEMQKDFLMAKSTKPDIVFSSESNDIMIDDIKIGVFPLPGHSPGQVGIAFDNVLFCADSLISKEIADKYKIPYNCDIEKTKESLRKLIASDFKFYIPSHGALVFDIKELAIFNIELIEDVEKRILKLLITEKTTEDVLSTLCNSLGVTLAKAPSYYLMNSAVMAYLGYLHNSKKIMYFIRDNSLYWKIA
ncbi:MAG: MBL fold metallo-hydrolase [archaeon]